MRGCNTREDHWNDFDTAKVVQKTDITHSFSRKNSISLYGEEHSGECIGSEGRDEEHGESGGVEHPCESQGEEDEAEEACGS